MSERLNLISKMKTDKEARVAYIKGKLSVFIPSQIRALRFKSDMPRQADLAKEVEMQQSRISMFESPGAANFTIDTLARLAAVFRVGLLVKFVPFHKMLQEDNGFSQDTFNVLKIENDKEFLEPPSLRNEGVELSCNLMPFKQNPIEKGDKLSEWRRPQLGKWTLGESPESLGTKQQNPKSLNRGNKNAALTCW